MVRDVDVKLLTDNIKEMCIEATHFLTPDMDAALKKATAKEEAPLGKQVLGKPSDCRQGNDSDLSGLRYGSCIS